MIWIGELLSVCRSRIFKFVCSLLLLSILQKLMEVKTCFFTRNIIVC